MRQIYIPTQYLAGFIVTMSVASSAAVFGWVAPVMNLLLDPTTDRYMTSSELSWLIVIPEFADLVISIFAGSISDRWGRKPFILLTGPILAVSWMIIIFSNSYLIMCLVRLLQGVGVGIVFSVVPTYLGEISSPAKRGAITGLFSSAFFLGYLIEYCIGPFVSYSTFTAITAVVPIMFTILFITQPETPYYLIMKGRESEAKNSLNWLRRGFDEAEIKEELEEIKRSVKADMANTSTYKDVVRAPVDRRALFIVLLIGSVRILSGGFAITSYSTHLFSENVPASISPDMLTIVMGFSLFAGGFVNTWIVDILGRRPLIFISTIGSFVCMLVLTVYFYLQMKSHSLSRFGMIVPLMIISYSIFSVVGIYPVSMTYTSELFTAKTRGRAAGIASINLTVVSFICVKLYQILSDAFGLFAVFLFFTLISFFGTILLFKYAPETKGKTFAEIREELTTLTIKRPEHTSNIVTV